MTDQKTNLTLLRIGIPSPRSRLHPKVMNALKLKPVQDSSLLVFSGAQAIVYLLRPWDIPGLVESGRLDFAFCGLDVIEELGSKVIIKQSFYEYPSALALCRKTDRPLPGKHGLVVATEYPNLASRFLASRFPGLTIIKIRGAAEAFPHMEGIDAILDIVDSGRTLQENRLQIIETVFDSYPCFMHSAKASQSVSSLEPGEIFSYISTTFQLRPGEV